MDQKLIAPGFDEPVVIGGTGGSGTRLVAQLLMSAGLDLGQGESLNASLDALAFVELYDAYVDQQVSGFPIDRKAFTSALVHAINHHRGTRSNHSWGWKNPRSIFLLPLLRECLPGLRFVHVVRNGLDMATSRNQNQLRLHGRAILGDQVDRLSEPLASAHLWRRVNENAADQGRIMEGRYFLLRFEDLCADPAEALGPLLSALGLSPPTTGWATIAPPPSRAQQLPPDLRRELGESIGDALRRFGYAP